MSKKKSMTDEERTALVQRLQDDIEDFVAERSKKAQETGAVGDDGKSVDDIIQELQNHPAFLKEVDWSKPLSPEMEALMAIKYESENPKARAESYREEGNELFKKKDYRTAIANYTEGIKSKSPDRLQNAVLYTNRAAAHYHLGNYRSAFNDCIYARKFKPDHMKAIIRGALCSDKMNKHADTISWCKAGLMLDSENKELLEIKLKAEKAKRLQERDERKQAFKDRKEDEATLKLLNVIKDRKIQLVSSTNRRNCSSFPKSADQLGPLHPSGASVRLDEKGCLHWPVLLLYPEYAQTDFIQNFCENSTFEDHLVQMFGPDTEPPPWDIEHEGSLYPVSKYNTLLEVLQHKRYKVFRGTPSFIVIPMDSQFQQEFLQKI
ncbi:tetratricopeptide repeat protein 4-like [Pomacea canaliculata]|uniref:tetratricopeptide repeat protein 4-like n=1 Tax=Pomacea canaliculata TaxID=400727 RepID=UPI000D728C97|nr:tetratricopeptide repeat protein 4-like [Pomacea canaliculata]